MSITLPLSTATTTDGPTLYTEHIHISLLIFTHECRVLGLLKRVFGRSRARFAAANARSTKVLHLPRVTEKIDMVVVCLEKKNPYAHHIHSFPGIHNSIAQDLNNVQKSYRPTPYMLRRTICMVGQNMNARMQASRECIIVADVQEPKARAAGGMVIYRKEDHGRLFADLRPSVGDSGSSSSTKRTLVFIELL